MFLTALTSYSRNVKPIFFIMDGETGLKYQNKTLDVDPNHFDARMRKTHPKWTTILAYPGWYEDIRFVPAVSLSIQQQSNGIMQLVRDGLKVSILILVSINTEEIPGKIVDARWKPIWVNTDTGAAFFHYVIFKIQEYDKPAWLEYIMDPYPSDTPHCLDGYWLLRRLCRQSHVWIVFNDREKILYNKKYHLTESETVDINKMKEELKMLNRNWESEAKFLSAVQFHQHSFDLDILLA